MKVCLLIMFATICTVTESPEIKIPLPSTAVYFTINNAGFQVHGSVEGLAGSLLVDSQHMVLARIEGSVNASTVQTGIEFRDRHLKKPDYLDVNKFPQITITSTQLTKGKADHYTGIFRITIKGISKNISVPFTFSVINNNYKLMGSFSINRLEFNLGEESMILSNTVEVLIDFKGKVEYASTFTTTVHHQNSSAT